MVFITAFFTGCVGSSISVICGFGLGVFTMMFLPHFMSSTMASSAVVSLTSVFQAAWICIRYRKKVRWKDMIFMAIGYLVLATVCIIFGKNIPNGTLNTVLGVVLVLLSIYFIFFSSRLQIKAAPLTGLLTGSLGGIMSSLFGVGGPPASLYYSSAYDDKEVYLATIQTYFCITNAYATALRIANGIITKEVLLASAASLAGMIIGTMAGKRIFDKMNPGAIRKAVYVLMAVSGIILIAG